MPLSLLTLLENFHICSGNVTLSQASGLQNEAALDRPHVDVRVRAYSSQVQAYSARLQVPQVWVSILKRWFCGLASAFSRYCTAT